MTEDVIRSIKEISLKENIDINQKDIGINLNYSRNVQLDKCPLNLLKEECPKINVIIVRIRKKKGIPRKANSQMLFTPELFNSVFGFSIYNYQDSEWRDVLKKKEGVLHFRPNGTRL